MRLAVLALAVALCGCLGQRPESPAADAVAPVSHTFHFEAASLTATLPADYLGFAPTDAGPDGTGTYLFTVPESSRIVTAFVWAGIPDAEREAWDAPDTVMEHHRDQHTEWVEPSDLGLGGSAAMFYRAHPAEHPEGVAAGQQWEGLTVRGCSADRCYALTAMEMGKAPMADAEHYAALLRGIRVTD